MQVGRMRYRIEIQDYKSTQDIDGFETREWMTVHDVPRPISHEMTNSDYHISEICDFLQTYTVLVLSIIGSCVAVFLFYKHKLKNPIEELELASQKIAHDNLDFCITYDSKDEMDIYVRSLSG